MILKEKDIFLAIENGKTLINKDGSLIYSLSNSMQDITLRDINKDNESKFEPYPNFYLDFTIMKDEDVISYKTCGMSKFDFDKMINEHKKENEIATDELFLSGNWRKLYEEFCVDLIKKALERHGSLFLYDFSKKNNTEDLLWNFFENKNND